MKEPRPWMIDRAKLWLNLKLEAAILVLFLFSGLAVTGFFSFFPSLPPFTKSDFILGTGIAYSYRLVSWPAKILGSRIRDYFASRRILAQAEKIKDRPGK